MSAAMSGHERGHMAQAIRSLVLTLASQRVKPTLMLPPPLRLRHVAYRQVCTVKSQVSVYRYLSGMLCSMGSYTGNENVSSYYVKAKLSPDGLLLASGSPTDSVCVWDVAWPGAPIARLKVFHFPPPPLASLVVRRVSRWGQAP